jgi:hypothetical protein
VTAITLLTDFGTADYFAGAMKGAILSINPQAVIADVTHEIPAQDVAAGAFTLLAAYGTFPEGTVHVAVVDPGVGSARRPIVVSAGGHLFVGPDNGLFTHVYDREPSFQAFHVTASQYFRQPVSTTFHGRDGAFDGRRGVVFRTTDLGSGAAVDSSHANDHSHRSLRKPDHQHHTRRVTGTGKSVGERETDYCFQKFFRGRRQ